MSRFHNIPDRSSFAALILVSAGVSLGGCVTHQPAKPPVSRQSADLKPAGTGKTERIDVVPIPEKPPSQRILRDEIASLKQKLAEKDELIQNLNAREQDRAQILQKTAGEMSRAENKLHRLATQPEAASKIAEVEIAVHAAKLVSFSESEATLQSLAQRFLDAATTAYEQKNYSAAMNHAAQSGELIDAITNPTRKMFVSQDAPLAFRITVPLLTTKAINLQAEPNHQAKAITSLKRNTPLTATAYHDNWLQVQTMNDLSGWIQSQAVDIRANWQSFQE